MSHRIPEEILQRARQGEKVQAIALLRAHSGLGLAQAKQLLEDALDDTGAAAGQSFAPQEVMTAIDAALARGEKLLAIKLLCDSTGIGLLEAKQRIEQRTGAAPAPAYSDRSQSPGEVTRSSAWPLIALLLAAAMAAALWVYFSKH